MQSPKLLLVHLSGRAKVFPAWKLRHVGESEQSFFSALQTNPSLTIFTFHLPSVKQRLMYRHLPVSNNCKLDSFLPHHSGIFSGFFPQMKLGESKMPSCHQENAKKLLLELHLGDKLNLSISRGLLVGSLHPRALRIT